MDMLQELFLTGNLDKQKFVKWQVACITFLERILDNDDTYLINFKNNVKIIV